MGLPARLVRWLLLSWYRLAGWHPKGKLPPDRKLVIVGASHTSNWDFLVFLGTVEAAGRQARFIGKHSLFRGAVGRFMRSLGGVPVDRSAPQDLVSQIVEQFDAHDDFLVGYRRGRDALANYQMENWLLPDRSSRRGSDHLRRTRLPKPAGRVRPGDPPHRRL